MTICDLVNKDNYYEIFLALKVVNNTGALALTRYEVYTWGEFNNCWRQLAVVEVYVALELLCGTMFTFICKAQIPLNNEIKVEQVSQRPN